MPGAPRRAAASALPGPADDRAVRAWRHSLRDHPQRGLAGLRRAQPDDAAGEPGRGPLGVRPRQPRLHGRACARNSPRSTRPPAAARADERHARNAEHPATANCLTAAAQRTPLLWSRRPGGPRFLDLRVGAATLPSRLRFDLPQGGRPAPAARTALDDLRQPVPGHRRCAVRALADRPRSGRASSASPAPRSTSPARPSASSRPCTRPPRSCWRPSAGPAHGATGNG